MSETNETAVLGGGCFWCIEAIYQRVKGVSKVVSGYAGGHAGKVSYEQMHKQDTGHAEVIEITYEPKMITYEKLLEIFWQIHDPTTKDRQGNDVGPEYRSIILYADESQKDIASRSKEKANQELWDNKITTEIKPLDEFYEAEDYHQNYFNNNPGNMYCQLVINPKLAKLETKFKDYLV